MFDYVVIAHAKKVMFLLVSVCLLAELHEKFQVIFMKPCRIVDCCCGKHPLNCVLILCKSA